MPERIDIHTYIQVQSKPIIPRFAGLGRFFVWVKCSPPLILAMIVFLILQAVFLIASSAFPPIFRCDQIKNSASDFRVSLCVLRKDDLQWGRVSSWLPLSGNGAARAERQFCLISVLSYSQLPFLDDRKQLIICDCLHRWPTSPTFADLGCSATLCNALQHCNALQRSATLQRS